MYGRAEKTDMSCIVRPKKTKSYTRPVIQKNSIDRDHGIWTYLGSDAGHIHRDKTLVESLYFKFSGHSISLHFHYRPQILK